VALGATTTNDGILRIAGAPGAGAFAVATSNVGAGDVIDVSVDTGSASLPVTLSLCQTDPGSGACLADPSETVSVSIGASETPTFAFFVSAAETITLDPAVNRIFARFRTQDGVTRGSTGVAVTTQ